MAISSVRIPPESSLTIKGPASKIKTSSLLDRYFCGNCGTNVCTDSQNATRRRLCGGAICDDDNFAKARIVKSLFVGSTIDGGIREWLTDYPSFVARDAVVDGSSPIEIPRHEFWRDFAQNQNYDVRELRKPLLRSTPISTDEKLYGYCFCGDLDYYVTRPNADSYSSLDPHPAMRDFIDNRKSIYPAALCPCNDCRPSSGHELQGWACFPKVNIFDSKTNKPLNLSKLGSFQRSENHPRYFCKTCGATAFQESPGLGGVLFASVGLLDSKAGVRAEDWLEWSPKALIPDSMRNKPLQHTLEAGMNRYFALFTLR
jgi:hypothetical protein